VTITGGNGAVALTEAASANITTSFGSVDARNVRGISRSATTTGTSKFRASAALPHYQQLRHVALAMYMAA